jgi:uncharacterized protein (TIGR00369 family)
MLPRVLLMDIAQLETFIAEHFPQAEGHYQFISLSEELLQLRLLFREAMLRPGGTVSGPAMMGLADAGAYYLILARIGPVALAVTSSLTINFLRKPEPVDVLAEVRMLKLGRQLAVCEVQMRSVGQSALVAQATVTYALPSAR